MEDAAQDDSDSDDPIFGKKKKKQDKKGAQKAKRGGNRQKNKQEEEEDELPPLEETKEEAKVEEPVKPAYPLNMIYCGVCGLPPEYCEWSPKKVDQDECKAWLLKNHPEMHEDLYAPKGTENAEESKEGEEPKKKKKKVKIEVEKRIRVIKLKRGGKKVISDILGLDLFGCNLADVAKTMGKKFGTGAAAITVNHKEISEEGIQVQGDVEDRLEEFFAKDLAKYQIPWDCVTFEQGGNFKTR